MRSDLGTVLTGFQEGRHHFRVRKVEPAGEWSAQVSAKIEYIAKSKVIFLLAPVGALEVFPFRKVAAAAVSVPPSLRIKGNIEKYILREAVLPEALYKREKFAFMAPPAHTDQTKRDKVEELITSFLGEDSERAAGICSPKKVTEFLNAYHSDDDAVSFVRKDTLLNRLLTLHILDQKFCR